MNRLSYAHFWRLLMLALALFWLVALIVAGLIIGGGR